MHVHVHLGGGHREKETVKGLRLPVKHVLVRLAHGVRAGSVAHEATVDEEVLCVPLRLREGRKADEARQAHAGLFRVDRAVAALERPRHQSDDAFVLRFDGLNVERLAAVLVKDEAHRGVCQGDAMELRDDVRVLRRFGLHEFASGGRLVKEVAHLDARALLRARRGDEFAFGKLPGTIRPRRSALNRHRRDRVDRSERFAAKAERRNVLKVEEIADFARRVALERERELFLRDAATVVRDDDALQAAPVDAHFDIHGARVDGVFHEFFDDRRGALDHLARRNLTDELGGELPDGGTAILSWHEDPWYGIAKS